MKSLVALAAALTCAVLLLSPASAVVYVKQGSSSPTPDGNSWETAYQSIQPALNDAAVTGEEVWVAAGTYVGKITLKSGVALKGGYSGVGDTRDIAANETTIDAANSNTMSYAVVGADLASIDGFTITGGWVGVYCSSCSPSVTNNRIIDNKQAGFWLVSSSATATGNTISGSSYGVLCWNGGSASVTGNVIFGNERGVGCYTSAGPTISGNAISWNSLTGVYSESSAAVITNNSIWGNDLYGIWLSKCSPLINANTILLNGLNGIRLVTSASTITNNVIAGHESTGISCSTNSPAIITNNTIAANDGGIGCYTSSSPVIRNNIVAYNQWGIFNSMPSTAHPDLGNNCVYGNGLTDYAGLSAGPGDIRADPAFVSLVLADLHIAPNSPCRNAGDNSAPGIALTDLDDQTRIEGSAIDIGADESHGETLTANARLVFVKAAAAPGGDGTSWSRAYRTIQNGVDDILASGPAAIWVARGTYVEQVTMRPFASIYGGFAGSEASFELRDIESNATVIDAGNTASGNHAVTGASASAIDGFTIRGGYHGIYASNRSPIISNNLITANAGNGAICLGSSPVVTGNVFSGNAGDGLYVESGVADISNNRIVDNGFHGIELAGCVSAVTNSVIACNMAAGIACLYGLTAVTNNTIVDNDDGILCVEGVTFASNNIVAGSVTGISASNGDLELSHNCIFGNATDYSGLAAGPSDISLDPLLTDPANGNYHLLGGSPCVNAGDNNAPFLPKTDMDGDDRIALGTVDIGADEMSSVSVQIDILPGVFPNRINPKSKGKIAVAVLTTADFNATSIDPATTALGGCPVAKNGNAKKLMSQIIDADSDGDLDLLLHFDTSGLPLIGATALTLTGRTRDGWPVEGTDSVVVTG